MANLVVESGGNKGQLSYLVEAICRDFHEHDEAELRNATDKTAERSPLDNRRSAPPADRMAVVTSTLKRSPICADGVLFQSTSLVSIPSVGPTDTTVIER